MADARQMDRGLSVMDGWIAAVALTRDLDSVTRNQKDFNRLGLLLFDPWQNSSGE